MKYEIITDKEDLIVLVLFNNVVAVSHDMSVILEILHGIYLGYKNNQKKPLVKAVIHPELDHDMYKEEIVPTKKDKAVDSRTGWEKLVETSKKEDKDKEVTIALGKLFQV